MATEPHSYIATHKRGAAGDRFPLRLCSYVAMCLCGYVAVWLCGYVAMRLCFWIVRLLRFWDFENEYSPKMSMDFSRISLSILVDPDPKIKDLGLDDVSTNSEKHENSGCSYSNLSKPYMTNAILRLTRPLPPAPFSSSQLPFGRLGASILAPWGTVLAPRKHLGGPWKQQDGHEVVRNKCSSILDSFLDLIL